MAVKAPFAELYERPESGAAVLADGWYEWLKAERKGGARLPFRYTVDGGEPFAFAGLWRRTRVGGELVHSALILTCPANAVAAPVHDRMPCVLAGPEREPPGWSESGRPARPARPRSELRGSGQPGGQQGRGGRRAAGADSGAPPRLSFDA